MISGGSRAEPWKIHGCIVAWGGSHVMSDGCGLRGDTWDALFMPKGLKYFMDRRPPSEITIWLNLKALGQWRLKMCYCVVLYH
jgi:hypothetical protein